MFLLMRLNREFIVSFDSIWHVGYRENSCICFSVVDLAVSECQPQGHLNCNVTMLSDEIYKVGNGYDWRTEFGFLWQRPCCWGRGEGPVCGFMTVLWDLKLLEGWAFVWFSPLSATLFSLWNVYDLILRYNIETMCICISCISLCTGMQHQSMPSIFTHQPNWTGALRSSF